ncbi:MAG: hydroxyacid dehydrogenase [Chloroflexi bacterium]|nr:MAG: hydroxyacid dehydrogenase [Chloroflexota bacterium]
MAQVTYNTEERDWTSTELAEKLPGFDAIITGWGSPKFTGAVIAAAGRLKLIAHSAGSIKAMLPLSVFDSNIVVTHGAGAIAPAVAEMTLLLIMMCLRPIHKIDRGMKSGQPWGEVKAAGMGQEIVGQRVGVVGAGYTGRQVIALLRALNVEVWVYDPYLGPDQANQLGVRKVELADLFANCPIVTLQAPPTKETYHMVGAKELSLLQDGAVFINTARGHLVDQEALLTELKTGRFQAALDVFDPEPLPNNSPFLTLDNVITTPHLSAATRQARRRQGQAMVEEIERFFTGKPLQYQITREKLDIIA